MAMFGGNEFKRYINRKIQTNTRIIEEYEWIVPLKDRWSLSTVDITVNDDMDAVQFLLQSVAFPEVVRMWVRFESWRGDTLIAVAVRPIEAPKDSRECWAQRVLAARQGDECITHIVRNLVADPEEFVIYRKKRRTLDHIVTESARLFQAAHAGFMTQQFG